MEYVRSLIITNRTFSREMQNSVRWKTKKIFISLLWVWLFAKRELNESYNSKSVVIPLVKHVQMTSTLAIFHSERGWAQLLVSLSHFGLLSLIFSRDDSLSIMNDFLPRSLSLLDVLLLYLCFLQNQIEMLTKNIEVNCRNNVNVSC